MDAIVCVDHLPNKHQPFLSQFDLNESYEISDQMIVPKVADTRKNGALGEAWVTRLQGRRDRRRSVLHRVPHALLWDVRLFPPGIRSEYIFFPCEYVQKMTKGNKEEW